VDVLADLHASADYRRAMALVYARRALTAAAARAAGKRA
jgi:CO/xanthine dehydrogenase FAD-binding subunit